MGNKLSIDQLAKRSATKKNNQIRKKYPLFAEQFAVTIEQEKERILRQRKMAQEQASKDKEQSIRDWQKGLELREIARKILPPERFSERERIWQRWHGNRTPEYDGSWIITFWWCSLKGTDYAAQYCPNKRHHSDPTWWQAKHHITSLNKLEITECPTCGMKKPSEG